MDENSKIVDGGAVKPTTENPVVTNPNSNSNSNSDVTTTISNVNSSVSNDGSVGGGGGNISPADNGGSDGVGGGGLARQSSRTPFTNLSQVDADLALARTLQEQERAYMMLSMNAGGVGYGRWETGIYVPDDDDDYFGDSHEHGYDEDENEDDDDDGDEEIEDDMENYDDEDEDAFDVHAHDDESLDGDAENVELDPSAYPDDEAYARALQYAEEREMAARLLAMAGLTEREIVDVEDREGQSQPSQDTWASDPDELSYEELLALGEVVGTESRGLSADTIASLPSTNYKSQGNKETETDPCIICRLEYEDGDQLTTLPCKHAYHSDCINNWLKIKKACPVCSKEVSTSTNGNS